MEDTISVMSLQPTHPLHMINLSNVCSRVCLLVCVHIAELLVAANRSRIWQQRMTDFIGIASSTFTIKRFY
jgi:hypothetical protein